MADRLTKIIKVQADFKQALSTCKQVLQSQKMNIKSESVDGSSFVLYAAEKLNILSTNWPAKVEITGQASSGGKIVITIALHSSLGSLTQAGANSSKVSMLAENIQALLS